MPFLLANLVSQSLSVMRSPGFCFQVTRLPWNEQEIGTDPETSLIKDQLVWCNEHGILTINSQPPVNGTPSADPLVGWGRPGGYCYQRVFNLIEFYEYTK